MTQHSLEWMERQLSVEDELSSGEEDDPAGSIEFGNAHEEDDVIEDGEDDEDLCENGEDDEDLCENDDDEDDVFADEESESDIDPEDFENQEEYDEWLESTPPERDFG